MCLSRWQDGLSLLVVMESDWDVKENRFLSERVDGRKQDGELGEKGMRKENHKYREEEEEELERYAEGEAYVWMEKLGRERGRRGKTGEWSYKLQGVFILCHINNSSPPPAILLLCCRSCKMAGLSQWRLLIHFQWEDSADVGKKQNKNAQSFFFNRFLNWCHV